jgi:hypothetical protein
LNLRGIEKPIRGFNPTPIGLVERRWADHLSQPGNHCVLGKGVESLGIRVGSKLQVQAPFEDSACLLILGYSRKV